MLDAVNTIHDERIVHSDLKPANFLLVRGALKLIDFGIAKAIMNDTTNIQRDTQVQDCWKFFVFIAFFFGLKHVFMMKRGNEAKIGVLVPYWLLKPDCVVHKPLLSSNIYMV
jgi:serine/threonine protein kinase